MKLTKELADSVLVNNDLEINIYRSADAGYIIDVYSERQNKLENQ